MKTKSDVQGRRFGMWTVISRTKETTNRHYKWLLRCDCGTERVMILSSLLDGKSKSCGCSSYELKKATVLKRKQLADILDVQPVDIYLEF